MNRAVALLLSVSLLGCFPHDPRKRTYAQLTEGGLIVAGIVVGATSNTSADCDMMATQGTMNKSCKDKAQLMSTLATVLVVSGLLGFVATISTAEDDKKPTPPIEIKANEEKPAQQVTAPGLKPATAPPAATGSASAAGSAAGSAEAGSDAAPQP